MFSTSCLVSPSCNLIVGGVGRNNNNNNNNNRRSYIEYQQRRRSYNMAARRSTSSIIINTLAAAHQRRSHNFHHHRLLTIRPQSSSTGGGVEEEEEEEILLTTKKIEEAIHGIIVRRSAPDWLPFVSGSSYWVPPPPRDSSYGIADLLNKLSNSLTHDELMSLITPPRGWPSSAFFLPTTHTHTHTHYYFNGTSPAEDAEN